MIKSKFLFLLQIILFISITEIFSQTPPYLDPNLSPQDRLNDLLPRMTLDEKIGQMTQPDHAAVQNLNDVTTLFLGSILSGGGSDPSSGNSPLDWANLYDSFQTKAMQTRLKIPLIYGVDAVHGHSNVVGATIFPHNIGIGATRNPSLAREIAKITAKEIAATGIDWTFAPCVAVPRNERWGRTYEGYGETPELAQMFAGVYVSGFQNDSLNSPTSIAACAKHYMGDGGTTNGIDQGNTEVTEAELRAIHLPGYIEAIENNVQTIMASYSSWNGQKMHGNHYLLTDVLKNELGFEGFVVSDWGGIDQLPGDYHSDVVEAINAGVDMIMVPNEYQTFITELKLAIANNEISMERIDDAVSRILLVKFRLGLFENPYSDRALLAEVGKTEHRNVARQAVRESLVMLKKNDNVLPLPKSGSKILVIGEHANNIGLQCGGWTVQWQGESGEVTEGTTILEGLQKVAVSNEYVFSEDVNFTQTDADYAIVVIGEQPYAEMYGDRENLELESPQIEMVRKLKNMGIPVITILISGRPMLINPALHNSDVFIAAWLPGTEGDGIAEVLFGDFQPKGILPVSWAKSMSQIPINYGDANYEPLFPYNFGINSLANSEVGSNPILQSALVTEDGMHVELSFNKSMVNSENTNAVFQLIKNGTTQVGVSSFAVSEVNENVIVLTLSERINKGDVATISYQSGNLKSADGGIVDFFSNFEIINYLNYIAGINILPGKVEAEHFSDMFGIQTEATTDIGGGMNVGWIDSGDWLEYESDVQHAGTFFVNLRVASLNGGGNVQFQSNGNTLFSKTINSTGGWQNWTTISGVANLTKGEQTIKLLATSGGFNINWFELITITDLEDNSEIADDFQLFQNYPNPFNPITKIKFSIPKNVDATKNVRLVVYNTLGQQIAELINQSLPNGFYEVVFDAENSDGKGSVLASGVYFYTLQIAGNSITKKMTLLK